MITEADPEHRPVIAFTKPQRRWWHNIPFFAHDYVDHLESFVRNLEIDFAILNRRWKEEVAKHQETVTKYFQLESVTRTIHGELDLYKSRKADLHATLVAGKQILEESILQFRGETKVVDGELVIGPPNLDLIRINIEAALRHVTLAISKERGFTNSHDKHSDPNRPVAPELAGNLADVITSRPVLSEADQPDALASHGDLRTGEEVAVGLDGVRVNLHEAQVIDKEQLARILEEVKRALEKRLK